MSDPLLPAATGHGPNAAVPVLHSPEQVWERGYSAPTPPPLNENQGVPWDRYRAALWRYKWLVIGLVAVGTTVAFAVSRLIRPTYDVRATIWVSSAGDGQQNRGPIRAGVLLESTAWAELFRSFVITDSVVNALRLYVTPNSQADSALFSSFSHTGSLVPGRYTLRLDATGQRYTLSDARGVVRDQGLAVDSVGRPLGFAWQLPGKEIRGNRTVEFTVVSPRDASLSLNNNLVPTIPEDGKFLRLQLTGTNPRRTAHTLNAWGQQFVKVAEALKKRNLIEYTRILESQLVLAETELRSAEIALESFRINTITLPSEGGAIAAGVEATRDPVMQAYFRQKSDYDDVRHDREALEQLIENTRAGELTEERLLSVPGALNSAPGLREALAELGTKQAQLRASRQTLTDEHPMIVSLMESIRVLKFETIPRLAQQLVAQLRQRESDLGGRIEGRSSELKRIPPRTIEEMRLRRQVAVSENLYNLLKARYEEAKLAEAGATPDVAMLDSAVAPMFPSSNSGPRIILLGFVASLGLAVLIAILLDRLDRRFRYPDQATNELGLPITGAVPRIKQQRRRRGLDVESLSQTIEAFRNLRLGVRYAFPPGKPVVLTITSPSAGDGKSLVSSNLALSFANAGYRTLLIDGDLRRGCLHATFGTRQIPGFVDLLTGAAGGFEASKYRVPTTPNLWIIPTGPRLESAPELLGSDRVNQLIAAFSREFEVVLIDSPPLSAGIDPFALGVAAGSMLLVLRAGYTDRKLAEAKLKILDRLPVRIIGTALNDVGVEGEYRYYAYEYEKKKKDDGSALRIPSYAGSMETES